MAWPLLLAWQEGETGKWGDGGVCEEAPDGLIPFSDIETSTTNKPIYS